MTQTEHRTDVPRRTRATGSTTTIGTTDAIAAEGFTGGVFYLADTQLITGIIAATIKAQATIWQADHPFRIT